MPVIYHKDMTGMMLMSILGMTLVCFIQFPSLGHIFSTKYLGIWDHIQKWILFTTHGVLEYQFGN